MPCSILAILIGLLGGPAAVAQEPVKGLFQFSEIRCGNPARPVIPVQPSTTEVTVQFNPQSDEVIVQGRMFGDLGGSCRLEAAGQAPQTDRSVNFFFTEVRFTGESTGPCREILAVLQGRFDIKENSAGYVLQGLEARSCPRPNLELRRLSLRAGQ